MKKELSVCSVFVAAGQHKREKTSTWVVVDEALVDVSQLLCSDVSLWIRWGFEVQVIFTFTVKL